VSKGSIFQKIRIFQIFKRAHICLLYDKNEKIAIFSFERIPMDLQPVSEWRFPHRKKAGPLLKQAPPFDVSHREYSFYGICVPPPY